MAAANSSVGHNCFYLETTGTMCGQITLLWLEIQIWDSLVPSLREAVMGDPQARKAECTEVTIPDILYP